MGFHEMGGMDVDVAGERRVLGEARSKAVGGEDQNIGDGDRRRRQRRGGI